MIKIFLSDFIKLTFTLQATNFYRTLPMSNWLYTLHLQIQNSSPLSIFSHRRNTSKHLIFIVTLPNIKLAILPPPSFSPHFQIQNNSPLLIFSHRRNTSSPPLALPADLSTLQITNSFNDSEKCNKINVIS